MATLTSITISPNEAYIYLGDETQYQCLAYYDDNSIVDVTELATWSVGGSPLIADFSLTTKGLLIGTLIGSDIASVSYGGFSASGNFTIHNPLVIPCPEDEVGAYRPVTQDYLDLITSQYQNSSKYLHWVRTFLKMIEGIRELATSLVCYFSFNSINDPSIGYLVNTWTVKNGHDLDYTSFEACVGVQLDMLGVILNQSRTVYFAADTTASPPTEASMVTLGDDDYRLLLKNKIVLNQWDGKAASLQSAWTELFPGGLITVQDNQNMTLDVTVTGGLSDTFINLIKNDYIVPRPQGVKINYYYGNMPFFGFDRQDSYIAGFDTGYWV